MKFNYTTKTSTTDSKGKVKKTVNTSFFDTKTLDDETSAKLATVVAKTMNIELDTEELDRFIKYVLNTKSEDNDENEGDDNNNNGGNNEDNKNRLSYVLTTQSSDKKYDETETA